MLSRCGLHSWRYTSRLNVFAINSLFLKDFPAIILCMDAWFRKVGGVCVSKSKKDRSKQDGRKA